MKHLSWKSISLTTFLLCSTTSVRAQYTFTKIADSSTFSGGFYAGGVNNSGTVAFTGFKNSSSGIYTGSGGALTTIAVTGSQFSFFNGPDINSTGTASFRAVLNGPGNGIYTGNGGPLTTIAVIANGINGAPISDDGTALYTTTNGQIYTGKGGAPTLIASTGSVYSSFGSLPGINNSNTVAFLAGLTAGGSAIFTQTQAGVLKTIATAGGSIANLGQVTPVNDAGVVAYYANLTNGGAAIYRGDGNSTTLVADTTGPFQNLSFGFDINNSNKVAFKAYLGAGQSGIFTGTNLLTDTVIQTGTILFGKTVNDVSLGALNDKGQISFSVLFSDFSYGLFRADPPPATLKGRIALEGVNDLMAIDPHAPLGTFRVSLRKPGTTAEVFGANVTLTPVGAGSPFGTYTVTGFPAGKYDVAIKGSKNLRVGGSDGELPVPGLNGVAANGIVALPDVLLPAGDADNDNRVFPSDFLLLSAHFGVPYSDPLYLSAVDFDFDGFIGMNDLMLLVGHYSFYGAAP